MRAISSIKAVLYSVHSMYSQKDNTTDMALWLKCLLLLLELSFVLSGVIVVKLDGEEDINTITDIIDSKLDEQDALLHKLNSTFQDALDKQQEQIDNLTEELQQLKKKVLAPSDDSKITQLEEYTYICCT